MALPRPPRSQANEHRPHRQAHQPRRRARQGDRRGEVRRRVYRHRTSPIGWVVSSPIARGKIVSIDASEALKLPGVIQVFTHENRPGLAWFDSSYRDQIAPPGSPFRPLHDAEIHFSAQPVALVVADSLELARFASTLVRIEYEHVRTPRTCTPIWRRRVRPKERDGIKPPPKARGHADKALAASAGAGRRQV